MAASGYQKKTVTVISAECINKFMTNLMVFIKGLLIQLFLSFDAEKLINQLFNPNFVYTAFSPLFFVIDCVTFIRVFGSIWGEIGYLAFVKMCLFFSYFFCCQLQLNQMNEEIFHISLILIMVFCYQNCSDLLWEKSVLGIEKNFWDH